MLIVCLLQIGACVWVFLQYDAVEAEFKSYLTDAVKHGYLHEYSIRGEVDKLHQKYTCCGVESPRDWSHVANFTSMTSAVSVYFVKIEHIGV